MLCTSCGVLVGVNDPTCYNCGRRNPGLWGFAPALRGLGNDLGFVNIVTGGTIIMYVLSVVMSREGNNISLEPNIVANQILGASGAIPVFGRGWWWTVLTAGWLHGGIFHIFFNVLWIRQLGPEIANLYGAGRMVIIYTLAGVERLRAQQRPGSVLAAVLRRAADGRRLGVDFRVPRRAGALRPADRQQSNGQAGLQWALIITVMGFVFRGAGIDNAAHLGGFVGGYLASMVLDPLKKERIDHIAAARRAASSLRLPRSSTRCISALPYLR